jgi:uncharacterized protein (DUF169 family)
MKSEIAHELRLRYEPVATVFTNKKPEGGVQFSEGKWGCVASMHVAASKGIVAVFDRKTFGCASGGIGLGFNVPLRPHIAEFLSVGSPGQEGEHYWKSPELAQKFVDRLPVTDIPEEFVVFMPLSKAETEKPALVSFYVNADQLSAFVVLANYGRDTQENVIVRMGAGCHTICLYAIDEAKRKQPRAVLGMMDVTVRPHVDADLLCITVPFSMYEEMEQNVRGSFLEVHDWKKIQERIQRTQRANT